MAYSVLDSARNSYGIFMQGGPHVIWGRGLGCPDRTLKDLLVDGTLPPVREQLCEQDFLADYIPLTLTSPEDRADPLAIARAVGVELSQSLALASWDGVDELSTGCTHGGTLTARYVDDGTLHQLNDCRLWPGLSLTGTVNDRNLGEDTDGLSVAVSVSGDHSGTIAYDYSDRTEAFSISGLWNGQMIALPRLEP